MFQLNIVEIFLTIIPFNARSNILYFYQLSLLYRKSQICYQLLIQIQ